MFSALIIKALYDHNQTWLSYIDAKMLSWTCRDIHASISVCAESFTEIVYRKLRESLTDGLARELLVRIRKYPIVISGSFILACIYDENWYDDIDIYENIMGTYEGLVCEYEHNIEKIIKFVMIKEDQLRFDIRTKIKKRDTMLRISRGKYHHMWEKKLHVEKELKCTLRFTPMSKFLYKQLERDVDYDDGYDDDGTKYENTKIRTYAIGPKKQKIQHIPLDTCVTKVIAQSFDADILKNVYDGSHLRVWDWELLLARRDVIKPTGVLFKGYDILDISRLDAVREKSESRAKKYTQRGVMLTFHPDYDIMHSSLIDMVNKN